MFPARAGMSRRWPLRPARSVNVPRASGDEPNPQTGEWEQVGCSPRERG